MLSLSDLVTYFEFWYENRDLLDALARNNRSWMLMERIINLINQSENLPASGSAVADGM